MTKHIILWTLKDELGAEEKAAVKAAIKEGLEGLAGQIPGLVDIHVQINCLPSSNADLMLDSTFTDEAALKAYAGHPAHVAWRTEKCVPTPNCAAAWTLRSDKNWQPSCTTARDCAIICKNGKGAVPMASP